MSYIIPIGPYHPALEEPVHARLIVEGELIKDAEVFVGYNHRGIEKLATERNVVQTLVLVERVCGICSHCHALTYAMAVENINEVEVPRRGQYIRVITAELERLHSHLLWAGIAAHIIGHDSLFMHIWDVRELIMDMLEELSGNRVNYAMVVIGGSRRDISDDMRRSFMEKLSKDFKGKVCFAQPINYQTTGLFGTKEDIYAEARDIIRCFGGAEGGLIAELFDYEQMGWKPADPKNSEYTKRAFMEQQ